MLKPSAGTNVSACFSAIDRAMKTMRLYLGKGELCRTVIDDLHKEITAFLEENESLVFDITPNGFKYGEQVLQRGDKGGHTYFQIFKDGIREIGFGAGVQPDELRTLLLILSRHENKSKETASEDEAGDEQRDEDTVTRLWEADLPNVSYHAIDAYIEGEIYDTESGEMQSLSKRVSELLSFHCPMPLPEISRRGPPLKSIDSPTDLRSEGPLPLHRLTKMSPEEVEAWRKESQEDRSLEMERFTVVWGRLVQVARPEETHRLVTLMVGLVQEWMTDGNWDSLLRCLRVLHPLSQKEEYKTTVQMVLAEVASPAELERLVPALQELRPANVPKVVAFHRALGKRALETLCRMLAAVPPGPVIDAFDIALASTGLHPKMLHLMRLRSREPEMVTSAIQKLGQFITEPDVVDALRPLLGRDDTGIRNAVLRSLTGDRDVMTVKAVRRALWEEDDAIRGYAIREIGNVGGGFAASALLQRIGDKSFSRLNGAERRALLMTAARVGGDDVAAFFEIKVNKKPFILTKKHKALTEEFRKALQAAGGEIATRILGIGIETTPNKDEQADG